MLILRIIAAIEILLGGFGIVGLLDLLTSKMRTGNPAGIGWLSLPFLIAFLCFGFLGAGLLFSKKWSWWLHIIAIPVLSLILFLSWYFVAFDKAFIYESLFPMAIGIGFLVYLLKPQTRKLFK